MLTLTLPSPPHFESLRFPVERLIHVLKRHGLKQAPAEGQHRQEFEQVFGTSWWDQLVQEMQAGRLKSNHTLQQQFAIQLCRAWQEGRNSRRVIGPYHYHKSPQGFLSLEAVADSSLVVIVHLKVACSNRLKETYQGATLVTAFFVSHPVTGYIVRAEEAYRQRLRRHGLS